MAFIKLHPRGGDALPVAEVVRRLRDEFAVVDEDADQGRDHVADMILATLRFPDSLPHKADQLAFLQSVQEAAVYVTFGDALGVVASCCLMPDSALFFDGRDELHGPARELVGRCAEVLGYELIEG